jgi:multidrug efflux pump subunit AcrA (membrane-fusion protein)
MRIAGSMKTLRFPLAVRRAAVCWPLVLGVLFSAGCKKEAGESKPIVTVQTAMARQTGLVETVEIEATLYPINQAAITPKVSAPVRQFYVMRGNRVRQGQLLAVLENKDLSAAAIENRGALQQAQAAYSSATRATLPEEWKKAELEATASRQMLEAEQKLYSSREELYRQGALPRKELDQAGVALTQARNQNAIAQQHLEVLHAVGKQDQLKSAKGQLEAARGKFMGAEAQLHYSEIRSPISGTVAEVSIYAGETAAAGVPLLTVVDASKIWVKAHLAQEQAALVKVGDDATITVAGEAKAVAARITVVSPTVDANSTTIEVWAEADNAEGKLHPGSSAHLSIAVAKIPDAVVVPSDSVLSSGEGKSSVMVVGKDSIAHAREVKVGIREGELTQIVGGLTAGDTVVTSGAYGLPDGTQVQTAQEPAEKIGKSAGKAD